MDRIRPRPRIRPSAVLLATAAGGVLLGLHVGGTAAPMMPGRLAMNDEMRSLAAIRVVRLEIGGFGQPLEDAGLESSDIRRSWRAALATAGIEVVSARDEAADAPRLEVGGWSTGDERVPDGVGFTLFMKLIQSAHVDRLDETLTVPTYVKITGGLNQRTEAAAAARGLLDLFVQEFTYLARRTEQR